MQHSTGGTSLRPMLSLYCMLQLVSYLASAFSDEVPKHAALLVLPHKQVGVAQDLPVQRQRLPAGGEEEVGHAMLLLA